MGLHGTVAILSALGRRLLELMIVTLLEKGCATLAAAKMLENSLMRYFLSLKNPHAINQYFNHCIHIRGLCAIHFFEPLLVPCTHTLC
jgi:hypothetical protein